MGQLYLQSVLREPSGKAVSPLDGDHCRAGKMLVQPDRFSFRDGA
jgi:hypothetical protein